MAADPEVMAQIASYDQAKKAYDLALTEAFTISVGQTRPWTEEKCKLFARERCRALGFDDPDTYRWRLRAMLGSISE